MGAENMEKMENMKGDDMENMKGKGMENMSRGCSIEDLRREFDDIVGYEAIKDEMVQICDTIVNREYYTRLGADIPQGLLLYGQPGVGKTTMAECIARACGRPVFRLRRKDHGDGFIKRMKQTFAEAAENAPSVVLLDDIDKYAEYIHESMLMGMDAPSGGETEYTILQSCIDAIADKDVFVIGTTNREAYLPESLTRSGRFDRKRKVCPPSVHDAAQILEKYLGGKKLADDVDYGSLAVLANGSSCAFIESLANDAAVIAGYERSPEITMDHIARAYLKWYSFKMDEELSPEEKRRVAYHEAGHVVVMEHLVPGVMDIVTAKRESNLLTDVYIGGIPLGFNDDRNRIGALRALGGRAAIELVYGEVDDLSEGDVAVSCSHAEEKVRNGYDEYMHLIQDSCMEGSSNAVLAAVEEATGAELAKLYREALEIVAAERDYLERLADALCENDYLLSKDIQRLKTA